MDIMKIGTELLMQHLSKNSANGAAAPQGNALESVLGNLIGGGDSMDIAGLVNGLQKGGLADIAKSWLGDGENAAISADQVRDLVGGDKLAQAANSLGADEGSLLSSLQDVIPQMVDKSSSGGSLLDSIGGLEGVAGLAKKFL